MPLPPTLAADIDAYAQKHLNGDLEWHIQFFDFLGDDPALQTRLGKEFFAARYVYKLLEGIHVVAGWSLETEVRLQVFQYASIYEASLHHLLFVGHQDSPTVRSRLRYTTLKQYSIPASARRTFREVEDLVHDGRRIIAAFQAESELPESKVRFEDKVGAAVELGLIKHQLGTELVELYAARNAIHIHADLRKARRWGIEMSRTAYRRLAQFRRQVWTYLEG